MGFAAKSEAADGLRTDLKAIHCLRLSFSPLVLLSPLSRHHLDTSRRQARLDSPSKERACRPTVHNDGKGAQLQDTGRIRTESNYRR